MPIYDRPIYPYMYALTSRKVQNRLATIKLVEREWRWHWFKWTPITKKIHKCIEIEFNDEVDEIPDILSAKSSGFELCRIASS